MNRILLAVVAFAFVCVVVAEVPQLMQTEEIELSSGIFIKNSRCLGSRCRHDSKSCCLKSKNPCCSLEAGRGTCCEDQCYLIEDGHCCEGGGACAGEDQCCVGGCCNQKRSERKPFSEPMGCLVGGTH